MSIKKCIIQGVKFLTLDKTVHVPIHSIQSIERIQNFIRIKTGNPMEENQDNTYRVRFPTKEDAERIFNFLAE